MMTAFNRSISPFFHRLFCFVFVLRGQKQNEKTNGKQKNKLHKFTIGMDSASLVCVFNAGFTVSAVNGRNVKLHHFLRGRNSLRFYCAEQLTQLDLVEIYPY